MKGTLQIRAQTTMISIGQPKPDTILEGEWDIHMYKVKWAKLSRNQAPHINNYRTNRPKLSLVMYNVHGNIGLLGFGHRFFYLVVASFAPMASTFCNTLYYVGIAMVGTKTHLDTSTRPTITQTIGGWVPMGCHLERQLPWISTYGIEMLQFNG